MLGMAKNLDFTMLSPSNNRQMKLKIFLKTLKQYRLNKFLNPFDHYLRVLPR